MLDIITIKKSCGWLHGIFCIFESNTHFILKFGKVALVVRGDFFVYCN